MVWNTGLRTNSPTRRPVGVFGKHAKGHAKGSPMDPDSSDDWVDRVVSESTLTDSEDSIVVTEELNDEGWCTNACGGIRRRYYNCVYQCQKEIRETKQSLIHDLFHNEEINIMDSVLSLCHNNEDIQSKDMSKGEHVSEIRQKAWALRHHPAKVISNGPNFVHRDSQTNFSTQTPLRARLGWVQLELEAPREIDWVGSQADTEIAEEPEPKPKARAREDPPPKTGSLLAMTTMKAHDGGHLKLPRKSLATGYIDSAMLHHQTTRQPSPKRRPSPKRLHTVRETATESRMTAGKDHYTVGSTITSYETRSSGTTGMKQELQAKKKAYAAKEATMTQMAPVSMTQIVKTQVTQTGKTPAWTKSSGSKATLKGSTASSTTKDSQAVGSMITRETTSTSRTRSTTKKQPPEKKKEQTVKEAATKQVAKEPTVKETGKSAPQKKAIKDLTKAVAIIKESQAAAAATATAATAKKPQTRGDKVTNQKKAKEPTSKKEPQAKKASQAAAKEEVKQKGKAPAPAKTTAARQKPQEPTANIAKNPKSESDVDANYETEDSAAAGLMKARWVNKNKKVNEVDRNNDNKTTSTGPSSGGGGGSKRLLAGKYGEGTGGDCSQKDENRNPRSEGRDSNNDRTGDAAVVRHDISGAKTSNLCTVAE